MKPTLNFGGKLVALDRPLIIGIINITPDSFYIPSRKNEISYILSTVADMIESGADIIDLGAMSSRPGADIISLDDELDRIIPAVKAVKKEFPNCILSVDTIRSEVARRVVECGASCINDISGGTYDLEMMSVVGSLKIPYIMMHMQGLPMDMQLNPTYSDVVVDIMGYFSKQIRRANKAGIHDIIIDPGFGFGKTIEQNYEIIKNMEAFQIFDIPILAGVSRKSMIWRPLRIDAANALNGTTALHMFLLSKGVHMLRVHDVKEAKQCVDLWNLLK